MPNGISKETFIDADEKTRIALTYELLMEIYKNQCSQPEECQGRFAKSENVKWLTWGFRVIFVSLIGLVFYVIKTNF